jgi:hypothetical protein
MAENESLDLTSPHAKRWHALQNAAVRGEPSQKVGAIARGTLRRALRKVITQFERYGVTIAEFLANRGAPSTLRKFLRQTKGHPYAELLVTVLDSNPATRTECAHQWLHAILDKVFDQISLHVGGSEFFPSFYDTGAFFLEVRNELRDEVSRMAFNIVDDPRWKPNVTGKRGEPHTDATAELLSMSLVGGTKE